MMHAIPLEQAEGHLAEIIDRLSPGEEVVLTRNNRLIARLIAEGAEKPHPVPGRGKGMLTILSEDDEHLKDFAEYMP
jgi:antitoxin (DNA-binding transcriptional repressor) of toxin-antitoxin stability system